jgi:hypothetical protein
MKARGSYDAALISAMAVCLLLFLTLMLGLWWVN